MMCEVFGGTNFSYLIFEIKGNTNNFVQGVVGGGDSDISIQ